MAYSKAPLSIAAVRDARGVRDWLAAPRTVFSGDPAWVPPLNAIEQRRISPSHAPFFTFGDAALFIAYRGRFPVGRISAQINHRHLKLHSDRCGHFGFFDCIDDQEAAQALVDAAAGWLRKRGMSSMAGPMNFSLNEECGCLVSGFETRPALLMTHARRWTGALLEGAGFSKQIDLYAYRVAPDRLRRSYYEKIAGRALQRAGVSVRPFEMKRYGQEVHTLVDIFNDAWQHNWGFVPFSPAEIDALLAEMRPLIRSEYGRFVLVNDEPVGVMVALPNINEAIAPFGGRLLPFNWLKLLWLLKRERIRTARVPLLGIRYAYRSTPIGRELPAVLIAEFVRQWQADALDWVEFSWVLETNQPMVQIAERAAGRPVKTYRIYSKTVG
jgi:hypothetical protein